MQTQKILIVEDNPEFQTYLRGILGQPEIAIHVSSTAEEARKTFEKHDWDLVLLDLALPDRGGLEVLADLRRHPRNGRVPVLLLTASDNLSSKVAAFSLGADDYILKGVDPLEFRSKVEAKLRNLRAHADRNLVLERGPLHLDLAGQRCKVVSPKGEREVKLTAMEFKLLHFLARSPGRVFTREQILEGVWGTDVHVFDRAVDTHVYALRKKLGAQGALIEAVQNVGYRFHE
jgi:DNA-binding response OmpR family regulator